MFRYLLVFAALTMALTLSVRAENQQNKDDEVAKAFAKIAELGPGVHAIKTDKQGRIKSCVIVGQSRISTVLGEAKGLQDARTKARLDVSAQFVKWLKEKVSLHEKSEEETILFMEGSQDNDAKTLKESGKSVEKTGKKFESVSEGLIRGLQVVHFEVSGKDKIYTLVMGWSAESAKAVEKLGGGDKKAKGGAAKSSNEANIEDRKVTADDAKKFLPGK